jgi:hypothetical protein
MKDEYVDIPPELMEKAGPDQQWIERELDRIDPWRGEQGHDGADTAALRLLVLELRTQRDLLSKEMNQIAAWRDGKVGSHMDEPDAASTARKALKAAGIKSR